MCFFVISLRFILENTAMSNLSEGTLEEYVKNVKGVSSSILHKPGSKHLSQQTLIFWVNDITGLGYKHVEQLCTGEAYCALMNELFPMIINMDRVVKGPFILERHRLRNFKLLQQAFTKLNVQNYYIDNQISFIVQGNTARNYGLLKWFYKFYVNNSEEDKTDEVSEKSINLHDEYEVEEEENDETDILMKNASPVKSVIGQAHQLKIGKLNEEIQILTKQQEETPCCCIFKKRKIKKSIEKAIEDLCREKRKIGSARETIIVTLSLTSEKEKLDEEIANLKMSVSLNTSSSGEQREMQEAIRVKRMRSEELKSDLNGMTDRLNIIDFGPRNKTKKKKFKF